MIQLEYIQELSTEGPLVSFRLPAAVAPWDRLAAIQNAEGIQTKTGISVSGTDPPEFSTLSLAVQMPFVIQKLWSPTHSILTKKTETTAVIELESESKLNSNFQLLIQMSEIHSPRMWIETLDFDQEENQDHEENGPEGAPNGQNEAAMVVFYPEFDARSDPCAEIIIALDMSNSMENQAEIAKKIALDFLQILIRRNEKNFVNVLKFGNSLEQLFSFPRILDLNSFEECENFIKMASPNLGNTNCLPILMNSIVKRHPFVTNLLLISDGHVTDLKATLKLIENRWNLNRLRIFGLGIGKNCDIRSLQIVSGCSGGAVEIFDPSAKFEWEAKLERQIERLHQPSIENVRIVWNSQNSDDQLEKIIQAPQKISSVFNGERIIVYGFVPHC